MADKQPFGLIKYDAACKALAEAKSVDEAKSLHDKAEAVRAYARQAKNKRLEIDAAEIRIRAERRLGEILKETVKAKPGRRPKPKNDSVVIHDRNKTPSLEEMGISKGLSSRSQKLAAVPAPVFEQKLTDLRRSVEEEGRRVTTDLLKVGENEQKKHNLTADRKWALTLSVPVEEYEAWVSAAKQVGMEVEQWVRKHANDALRPTIDVTVRPAAKPVEPLDASRGVDFKAQPWLAKDQETRRHLHQFGMTRGREPGTVAEWEFFLRKGY